MEQPIELLGVGGPESDDDTAAGESSFRVERVSAVRRGPDQPARSLMIAIVVGVVVLVGVIATLRSPTSDASQSSPTTMPSTPRPSTPMPSRHRPSATALPATVPSRASQFVPIAPDAEGITLVAGRGEEKVFIDLESGQRMVADVAGIPVAGTEGQVAFALNPEQADADDVCWFSIADRACEATPPSTETGAIITTLDLDDVVQLRAISADARWVAGWRAGQLVVTDQETGAVHVVPDVRRTYFEDSVALVG